MLKGIGPRRRVLGDAQPHTDNIGIRSRSGRSSGLDGVLVPLEGSILVVLFKLLLLSRGQEELGSSLSWGC